MNSELESTAARGLGPVDEVSVQFYPPLAKTPKAGDPELRVDVRTNLSAWAKVASEAGKPLVLSEVGYFLTHRAASLPWLLGYGRRRRRSPMRLLSLALFFPFAALAGSTVSVSDLSVDGLEMKDIVCDLTQGGLFASMAVGAELASQTKVYDACHPAGAALRLSWTWADGATKDVKVLTSSEPKADACMVKALGAIASRQSGTCTATLLLGEKTAAQAAAQALAKPEAKSE